MHLIHIADSHLGRAAFQKTTEDGSNLRESLIYENFLAGIERIIEEDPDVLVHAGDLFDTVKPKTKALLVAMQALDLLKEAGIPLVIIAGNHSMQKNAYTTSAFEILKKAHPEIHAAYSFKYERFELQDTVFHCIPNMLHAADYAKAAAEVRMSKDHNNVLVTHGLASTIRDKRLATVAEFELTEEILSQAYNYRALGHVHNQQEVGPNTWYSGSQEHLTYGEIEDWKGGLSVTIEGGITTVRRLDLPRTSMIDLGIVDCAGFTMEECVSYIQNILDSILPGTMAQITLDWKNAPVHTIPAESIKESVEPLLDLKIRVRSDEIEKQQIRQQDLKTIDYLNEFGTFVQGSKLPDPLKAKVQEKGAATLRAVMAEHAEVTE